MCIYPFALIEMQKQTSVVTGVHFGRMNKKVSYNMSGFISGNKDDVSSSSNLLLGGNDDMVLLNCLLCRILGRT